MISQASTSKTAAAGLRQNLRCERDKLAILSGKFGTRVLGSPIWAIDARSDAPAFTNLGFVMDAQLMPLADTEDVELAIA
jgi:hypothetical protein